MASPPASKILPLLEALEVRNSKLAARLLQQLGDRFDAAPIVRACRAVFELNFRDLSDGLDAALNLLASPQTDGQTRKIVTQALDELQYVQCTYHQLASIYRGAAEPTALKDFMSVCAFAGRWRQAQALALKLYQAHRKSAPAPSSSASSSSLVSIASALTEDMSLRALLQNFEYNCVDLFDQVDPTLCNRCDTAISTNSPSTLAQLSATVASLSTVEFSDLLAKLRAIDSDQINTTADLASQLHSIIRQQFHSTTTAERFALRCRASLHTEDFVKSIKMSLLFLTKHTMPSGLSWLHTLCAQDASTVLQAYLLCPEIGSPPNLEASAQALPWSMLSPASSQLRCRWRLKFAAKCLYSEATEQNRINLIQALEDVLDNESVQSSTDSILFSHDSICFFLNQAT